MQADYAYNPPEKCEAFTADEGPSPVSLRLGHLLGLETVWRGGSPRGTVYETEGPQEGLPPGLSPAAGRSWGSQPPAGRSGTRGH